MSRRSMTAQKPPTLPAGQLALITIGLESILLPSAVAHKLLPLLEKGIAVNAYHDPGNFRQVMRDGEPLRVEYCLVDRTQLQLDKRGRPGANEEPS